MSDSKEINSSVTALNFVESLANNCLILCEAYLSSSESMSVLLQAASHKQIKVREAAEAAVMAIHQKNRFFTNFLSL